MGLLIRNARILKQSFDGGELITNIMQKKKSEVLQVYGCPLCDKQEYLFNKHVGYCESGKHDFSCGQIFLVSKQ